MVINLYKGLMKIYTRVYYIDIQIEMYEKSFSMQEIIQEDREYSFANRVKNTIAKVPPLELKD